MWAAYEESDSAKPKPEAVTRRAQRDSTEAGTRWLSWLLIARTTADQAWLRWHGSIALRDLIVPNISIHSDS